MSIESPTIPPVEEQKRTNTLMWGCLIAVVLALVGVCCAATLFFMPLISNFDPLGIDLRGRIEEYLPQDILDDAPPLPGLDLIEGEEITEDESNLDPDGPAEAGQDAESIPLAIFSFTDIGVSFPYPAGWDIEVEGYAVWFYDPDSFTYLYIGEDLVDTGMTAEEVADSVLDSLQEEAEEGSVEVLSSSSYSVPVADDAYLNLIEWVDQDGYYNWAYDLEIVSGESNLFLFLSGDDPDEIALYGELLDIIAASLTRTPVEIIEGDA